MMGRRSRSFLQNLFEVKEVEQVGHRFSRLLVRAFELASFAKIEAESCCLRLKLCVIVCESWQAELTVGRQQVGLCGWREEKRAWMPNPLH